MLMVTITLRRLAPMSGASLLMAVMTWPAMSGSGVRTGMIRTTMVRVRIIIRKDPHHHHLAPAGSCAAARGTTSRGTAVLPIGAGTTLWAGGATSGFGWRRPHNLLDIWSSGNLVREIFKR